MRKQFIVTKGQSSINQFMARGLGVGRKVKVFSLLISIQIKKYINFIIRINEK